jgi:DNA polymerase III delta prime subunit
MLIGPPGVGKGTFVNILLKVVKPDYIKINGSDETSVDVVRTKIKGFATTLGNSPIKIVYCNECLEENEEILVGKVGNTTNSPLKDLPVNELFELPSYNLSNGCIEDDLGHIVSDKEDDVYEIELMNGKKILVTADHPMIVEGEEPNTTQVKKVKNLVEKKDRLLIV